MATIAENLQIIKDSTDAIKQAIIDKGGIISGDITTWASAINSIESSGSDGGVSTSSGVNFYDYDGTLLYSYTKSAFLALSDLPELPTRDGLTCQGWNYTIDKAKEYVTSYGVLDIGATYITNDGKTRLYIKIAAPGRMSVPLYFNQSVANGVTIDWGDGSPSQTLSGTGNVNITHTYTEIGDYCISLTVNSGTLGLGLNSSGYCIMGPTDNAGRVYCNMLQKVEIGEGVTSIGPYAFSNCYSLSSVIIPESVKSIGDGAFGNCYSLSSVIIPESVTSIGGSAFYICYSLSSVIIPESVKSIGNGAFGNCHSLSSIVIPESVTSIGTITFVSCYSLSSVIIPESVKSIGENAFYYCRSLSSIVIPESVTSIGPYAFSNCYSLSFVIIPESVKSIGNGAFGNCYSLSSIVIPESVTSIGNSAFSNCYGMAFYDFRDAKSVPTLGSNAFSSIRSDCKIIVPDSLYDEWIVATNWSTYASYIIKTSDYEAL